MPHCCFLPGSGYNKHVYQASANVGGGPVHMERADAAEALKHRKQFARLDVGTLDQPIQTVRRAERGHRAC